MRIPWFTLPICFFKILSLSIAAALSPLVPERMFLTRRSMIGRSWDGTCGSAACGAAVCGAAACGAAACGAAVRGAAALGAAVCGVPAFALSAAACDADVFETAGGVETPMSVLGFLVGVAWSTSPRRRGGVVGALLPSGGGEGAVEPLAGPAFAALAKTFLATSPTMRIWTKLNLKRCMSSSCSFPMCSAFSTPSSCNF
mmetsp:Transcript_32017/g.70016  ORF Transcript_32017/g.70016 Transcript_32017/m.70016 type:complete len:200 (-) Transcript_32017:308-907(-)